jgi:hypothetical protein
MSRPPAAAPAVELDGDGPSDGASASPGLDGDGPTPGRARARLIAAAAVVLIALAVAAIVVGSGSSTPQRTGVGVPAGETTTTVTRRTLVESSTVDGTLGYGGSHEIYDRLSGTFTWLPAVGAVIGRGGTLFRVDNAPVTLMYGSVPAYRTMKLGVSDGPDVAELNANLVALGFDPDGAITAGEHFSDGTAAAVRRWQHSLGESETGQVELGHIVFAPDARRVTAVKVSLGQDPPGGSSPTESAPGASSEPSKPAEASKEPSKSGKGSKEPAKPGTGSGSPAKKAPSDHSHSKPKSSEHHPSSHKPSSKSPASEGSSSHDPSKPKESSPNGSKDPSPSGNGSAGAGTLVLSTTSDQQIVHLQVKAEQQQLARVGERAPVSLPGGSVAHGRITSVGTVATEPKENEGGGGGNNGGNNGGSNGSGSAPVISVTLTLDHPVARLDQAPVSVELVKNVAPNVLTVPATALVATGGGGYAIETLQAGRLVEVPVTPGMFANGYVQIEGGGVREGMTVTESQ